MQRLQHTGCPFNCANLKIVKIKRTPCIYERSKHIYIELVGRNSSVKFSQLSWPGQYKKCVQYDFKFTPVSLKIEVTFCTVPSTYRMTGLYRTAPTYMP